MATVTTDIPEISTNPPAKKLRKLTDKQLKFCHNYIKYEGNASKAYRKAYKPETATLDTIKNDAYKTKNKPHVAATISLLKEKMIEKLEITTASQVKKLESVYIEAMADKEYAPAISAINSQSKHLGLIADKPATTININMQEAEKQLRNVSPDKRAVMLELLASEFKEV